ncbi:hypothetical protein [Nocardia cyriacigeorgica]|uniref:hypothetical protein n=1 Tax=Nocardia cyriacigeorgica TaxID=135487 RepID=UPI0024549597|nr:hypothetical protein [Nocardia cyriacigeorgica]
MGGQDGTGPQLPPASSIPIPGFQELIVSKESQNAAGRVATSMDRAAYYDSNLADLGAGNDPDYVSTLEHFEGMTHAAMYQAVHGPGGVDAAGMRTLQRVWQQCSSDLLNLTMFNLMGLNRIFGSGDWQGESTNAAEAAAMQFGNAANQIGQVFSSVSARLDALAWAAEAVRTAVQPPPASTNPLPDPDNRDESAAPGLISPEYADSDRAARELARQEAVRVMNTLYKPNFPPAGSGVPSYVEVPQIGGGDGSPSGPSSGRPNGPGGSGGTPPGGDTGQPGAGVPPGQTPPEPGQGQPKTGLEGLGIPEGLGLPEGLLPGTDSTTAASTTAPGLGPNATSSPHSAGLGSSGPGGSGPGMDGSDRAGRSLADGGGPGSSRPGAPGAGAGLAPGAAGAGARPGAGGRGMPMAPMAPGGRRDSNSENESEHSAPDYLRGVSDEWTEGLGSPVGVIGEGLEPEFDSSTYVAADYRPQEVPSTQAASWQSPDTNAPVSQTGAATGSGTTAPEADWDLEFGSDDPTGSNTPALSDISGQAAATTNIASTAPSSASEAPEVFTVSGAGPMMDEPTATPPSEVPEIFTVSGSGPMMDDLPSASNTAADAPFTVSGVGPMMDDSDSARGEVPAEPEIFTVSGVGPMMDEPTEGAGRP